MAVLRGGSDAGRVLLLVLMLGAPARVLGKSSPGSGCNAMDLVLQWQDQLVETLAADPSYDDVPEKRRSIQNLRRAWETQKRGENSTARRCQAIRNALNTLSETVAKGTSDVASGVVSRDDQQLSGGVLRILGGSLTAIGAFGNDTLLVPAGAAMSLFALSLESALEIALARGGGASAKKEDGSPTTQIMSRVINHTLKELRLPALQEEFNASMLALRQVHAGLDQIGGASRSVGGATAALNSLGLLSASTKLDGLLGQVTQQIGLVLNTTRPEQIPALLQMYWFSTLNTVLLQQRALTTLSQACMPCGAAELLSLAREMAMKILGVRTNAKESFGAWKDPMEEISGYLYAGEPGSPKTRLHLHLYKSYDLSVGTTAKSSGAFQWYPYGTMRPQPSPVEVLFGDGSTGLVDESTYVSLVNRNTKDDADMNLLYFGHMSNSAKYCSLQNGNCGGNGKKVIDAAQFKLTRVGYDKNGTMWMKKSGPIRTGDVVQVWNKKWGDSLLCGADYNKDTPMVSERPNGFYLWALYNTDKPNTNGYYCALQRWKIVVEGDEDTVHWKTFVSTTHTEFGSTEKLPPLQAAVASSEFLV